MPGSTGKQLFGQLLYGARQVLIRFWQRTMSVGEAATYLGQPLTEVTPVNDDQSTVKVYSQPDLSSIFLQYTQPGDIELPNVLTSLTLVYNVGGGNTDYTENASASAAGTAWSVGCSVSGTAQASAYCVPKLLPVTYTPPTSNVPLINCFFYATSLDTATILSILTAKLGATVNAWPVFKPVPLFFTLLGEKTTASGRQDYQGSASFNSPSSTVTLTQSDGFGTGLDANPNIEQFQIPPTLHGAFAFTATSSETHTGTTTVNVSAGVISGGGTNSVSAVAGASISPTSVAATSITAIPTSGLYLYRVITDYSEEYKNFEIRAVVFDFASIA